MTYDQPDEMFRFVWRNESFRLSRFWPRPRPQRNGRMLDGRWNWQVWRILCTNALEAGGLSSVPTSSGLAFEPALRALQNEVGEFQDAKNLRKRALKSLK